MATDEKDRAGAPEAISSAHAQDPAVPVSESRRALIKAGLIGAPLVLTLKGRPAWGQEVQPLAVTTTSLTHSP